MEIGEYQKAADSYYQIVQVCPDNVEALQTATMVLLDPLFEFNL